MDTAPSAPVEKPLGLTQARRAWVSPETKEAALYCFKVFLGVRIGLGLVALLAMALIPINDVVNVPGWPAPPQEAGWSNIFTAWERWDALWFLKIASQGYAPSDNSAAFFPLYPLLIRAVAWLPGVGYLGAAIFVSNACFLLGLIVVHTLTREEFDDQMARRTVLYMAIFPTAFFFLAPYTESLFLLLSATAILAARRRRWEVAGIAGALAAATRSIGIVLVLPLALEAMRQSRDMPKERRTAWDLMWSLGWSVFVAFGTFSYLAYWRRTAGDWFVPLSEQGGWLREFSPLPETIADGIREGFRFSGVYLGGYGALDLVLMTIALAAAVWVALRAPLSYAAYTIASLIIPMSFVYGGRPFMSVPRFVIVLWPIFWALARFAERWRAHDLVVAASATGLGILTSLFVTWYWIF